MKKQISIVLVNVIMLMGCSGVMPDLGVNNGQMKPCPKTPNCVNSQTTDENHFIKPIDFTGAQQEAQDRILQILKSEKRTKILTVQANYIHAEFTSAVFKFVDDVEFYFSVKDAETTIIHIRSASRVGYSDLGANRKRIEKIRAKF